MGVSDERVHLPKFRPQIRIPVYFFTNIPEGIPLLYRIRKRLCQARRAEAQIDGQRTDHHQNDQPKNFSQCPTLALQVTVKAQNFLKLTILISRCQGLLLRVILGLPRILEQTPSLGNLADIVLEIGKNLVGLK